MIIDAYRGFTLAVNWFAANRQLVFAITPIIWLEVVEGAPNKREQTALIGLLGRFQMIYLTEDDQKWAMEQIVKFKLSHNIGMMDCLIAAPAFRLNLPLYTRNAKHFTPMLASLVNVPY